MLHLENILNSGKYCAVKTGAVHESGIDRNFSPVGVLLSELYYIGEKLCKWGF